MNTKCESISIRQEDDAELDGVFVYAVATLTFEQNGCTLVQELRSGGVSGIHFSDDLYLGIVGDEQRAELVEMLDTLGLADPEASAVSGS